MSPQDTFKLKRSLLPSKLSGRTP